MNFCKDPSSIKSHVLQHKSWDDLKKSLMAMPITTPREIQHHMEGLMAFRMMYIDCVSFEQQTGKRNISVKEWGEQVETQADLFRQKYGESEDDE